MSKPWQYNVPVFRKAIRAASSLVILLILFQLFSCAGNKNLLTQEPIADPADQRVIYILNSNIHSGIVIPVDQESLSKVHALKFFSSSLFAEFGWGEEVVYQELNDNLCHDAKAVLWCNASVIRVEGYRTADEVFFNWSDFVIQLTLSRDQYLKLLNFIEQSFVKDADGKLMTTSQRSSGKIIYYKSPFRYHLFNTCNTWVAKALQGAGLDISSMGIITAKQLYNEIKDKGIILKELK